MMHIDTVRSCHHRWIRMHGRANVLWLGCLLALVGGVAGCTAEAEQQAAGDEDVSVLTFNIWHDQHDWPRRRDHIVAGLRAMAPDVVCLQEVLQHTDLPNQARTLANSLDYHYTFVSVDTVGSVKRYGNAILTPHPIVANASHQLIPLDDYRVAAHARVRLRDRPLDVFCTHLHHTAEGEATRRTQVQDLLAFVDSTATGATIVAGDFNTGADAPELVPLADRFRDVYAVGHGDRAGDGSSTLNPYVGHAPRRIDHVFAESKRLEPVEARVVFDEPVRDSLWASDHFGILARLRWTAGDSK